MLSSVKLAVYHDILALVRHIRIWSANMNASKGQLSTPFHWIYVLFAGAVILLFFIGLVVKQKDTAEKELSITVSQKLDGIFTGASLSDQTLNWIDVPRMKFSFTCEDDFSAYTVGETGSPHHLPFQPFFAQSSFVTSQLVGWTLEFNMPYKVINLLIVGSPDVATYVVYDDGTNDFKRDILSTVPSQFGLEAVHIRDLLQLDIEADFVKMVFLTDSVLLPPSIAALPDGNVHALHVPFDRSTVTYYRKFDNRLELKDKVFILSSFDEKNPAFYAALFSDNAESYRCGMRKAFRRMSLLADIYDERAKLIMLNYPSGHECKYRYQASQGIFARLKREITSCSSDDACLAGILLSASDIQMRNRQLQENTCAALY